jgi:hypothetical protein
MKKSTFFKRLIDLGFMDEAGNITLQLKGVKDWPQDLDIENWEIDAVSPGKEDDEKSEGYVSGYAGGDWQDETRFTILIPAKGKPRCKMFDDPSCFAGKDIYKQLKSLVKKELKESQFKTLHESRVKTTKNHNNIVEALRDAIASFQVVGVQVQLIENPLEARTLDISYGPYHVFFDTLDDGFENYGKYLITLPLANEPSVQWIGGNENELFADLKDVFNVLDKIMVEPIKDGRNFTD